MGYLPTETASGLALYEVIASRYERRGIPDDRGMQHSQNVRSATGTVVYVSEI